MRRLLPVVFLACAGPSTELAAPPAPTRLEAVQARPAPSFDGRVFASGQATPAECERAARILHEVNADQGWTALKGCIERSRWPRGEFTLLQNLTSGFWDDELQHRDDAPRVLARVIALRGGDVEGDLASVQKSRAPLFTLAAALRQPDVYKGRYVVLRGALDDVKTDAAGKASARLLETSLRATAHEVDAGPRSRTETTRSFNGQLDARSTRYGDANARASAQSATRTEHSMVRNRFDNERAETGRKALGRLPQADPFLEPGKDFVFLARFDGVRAAAEEEAPLAVLTILGYYKPNALVVE